MTTPIVAAVEMGYGHLRAALPLADALGTPMLNVDRPPFADGEEQRLWTRVRGFQELLSRPSQLLPFRDPTRLLDQITDIPSLHIARDLSKPNLGARTLDWLASRGLGRALVQHLQQTGAPLITTFYAPAVIADRAGCEGVYCVVTDADINRVWAPLDGARSRIRFFAPSTRVVRRLMAYGVRKERITLTGFPLPLSLLGGPDLGVLRRTLARRIVRLDPQGSFRQLHQYDLDRVLGELPLHERGEPPVLTFAVGGAGAQAEMADEFLPSLRDAILAGRLRVNLVAGTRPEVAATFIRAIRRHKLESQIDRGVHVLLAPDFSSYYHRFNETLLDTDILWTKPSELSFYAALGIPLLLAKPVGAHERFNRSWLRSQGMALKQESIRHAGGWLSEWLEDGTLAATAWTGFTRMPKNGTYKILEQVREDSGYALEPPVHGDARGASTLQ